ncbi:MAG TPA: class I SAM-dependent methyltransferase [Gaiellaceae bacterium]|nr:class I SAM-dependent methyltransferase [Gaiellaceae bacterium]
MPGAAYGPVEASAYADGAPHLKHANLRDLYARLVAETMADARAAGAAPVDVLDLGAGQGDASIPFLALGARVTAVDDSSAQLARLREAGHAHLTIVEDDASRFVESGGSTYDVVVFSSFLHHVPDYVGLVRSAISMLRPAGQVLTFQDPLEYRSLPVVTSAYSKLAYFAWRIQKEDVIGGLRRRARRSVGIWYDDCPQDVIEYHATRGGVDHRAVCKSLEESGFNVTLTRYFSTQSRTFHRLGTRLHLENTFALRARRIGPPRCGERELRNPRREISGGGA